MVHNNGVIYPGRRVHQVYNQDFIIDERFEIVKELGHGAYGIVCSAKYEEKGADGAECYVAIKKITNIFSKKILCKRSLRELKLLQFFRGHKNITCLYDLDIVPQPDTGEFNEVYLYEELMECDMHQIIRSGQPLTDSHYQSFIYQTLCGLKYIHSADVLHRDLKPGNLLVNADCELKICDFGLARGFLDIPEENTGFMTEYVATRWYRAPEIMLTSSQYSTAIDMWSVGCILGELFICAPLFPGNDYRHQLLLIFQFLGTPSEDELNRCIKSPRAKAYISSLPQFRKLNFERAFNNHPNRMKRFGGAPINPQGIDLLRRLLVFDPKERLSVEEALEHPYVATYHDANDEPITEPIPPNLFDFDKNKEELDIEELKFQIYSNILKFNDSS